MCRHTGPAVLLANTAVLVSDATEATQSSYADNYFIVIHACFLHSPDCWNTASTAHRRTSADVRKHSLFMQSRLDRRTWHYCCRFWFLSRKGILDVNFNFKCTLSSQLLVSLTAACRPDIRWGVQMECSDFRQLGRGGGDQLPLPKGGKSSMHCETVKPYVDNESTGVERG